MLRCNKDVCIYPEASFFFKGLIIRAIILMNPHNPLAEVYTQKEMIVFLEFAKRYINPIIISRCEVRPVCVREVSSVCHRVLSLLYNLQHIVNNSNVWKSFLYHLVLSVQSRQSYSLLRPP